MSAVRRRFSTGLDSLDRELDGGIQVGALVAFVAPTRTQAEVLLYQLATGHAVHYVSTTRTDERAFYEHLPDWLPRENVTFQHVEAARLRDEPGAVLSDVAPESYLVVDTVDPIERVESRAEYLNWLGTVSGWARENDSVAVLHCTTDLAGAAAPRWRRLTEKRAEYTVELERAVTPRDVKTRLVVGKVRGGRAPTRPLPLVITDRVRVDTSRTIA